MLTASLIIGIVVSLLLTELVGLTAGGIIVPGYVALLLDHPGALLAFALTSVVTYAALLLLGTRLMLYGSRRFAVAILIGMTISIGAQHLQPIVVLPYLEWFGLGHVVPGLVAYQFDRQGIVSTILMIALAAPIVRLLVHVWVRL